MARTVRDTNLETRAARRRLRPRGKPYYRTLEPGLHLGYRCIKGGAGKWVTRHYLGHRDYEVETVATADDFSDADGTAILDFRQAQVLARERMVQRAHAAAGKTANVTVADAMDSYIGHLEERGQSTVDTHARDRAFIRPELGPLEVTTLTTEMLENWRAGLLKKPPRVRTKRGKEQKHKAPASTDDARRARRATVNRTLTVLKAALNLAWHQGKVSSDSAWRRVKPFKNVEAARIRYLTVAEAKRLMNACDLAFRRLVHAALQTGARYGELVQLTVSDFNPDVGTVGIRRSKSGKPRHVVLTDEGIQFFRELCAGRPGTKLVFQKENGDPWGTSHARRPMTAACMRAKITPPVGFHVLRHTWASLSIMNGVPPLVAARNLGHSDTRMVEKHYGHLAPSYIADAIRTGAPRFGTVKPSKVTAMRSSGLNR